MGESLKDKKILVVDEGIFHSSALKLAEKFGQVCYYCEWKDAYPNIHKAIVGSEWEDGEMLDTFDGLPITRIDNVFDYIDDVDIAYFPDVYRGDMQLMFERMGKPVFGSRKGEDLELERWDTKQYMKSIGMDVQPVKRIVGLDNLREYLKKNENKWVKISKYRGIAETFHHLSYELSEPLLSKIEWNLGVVKPIVEFVVEDHIDAIVEEGMDGYTVDGKFPDSLIAGVEVKDSSYAGKFFKYEELSEGVKEVNGQIADTLKELNYRGFLSTEIRTTKDGKHYQIDWCSRQGFPPSSLYQEMYENFAEIIWEGAHGNLINPVVPKPYGIEVIIHADSDLNTHRAIYFPQEYRQWVKLKNPLKIDGNYFTLNLHGIPEMGSVVMVGDSFEECKKKIEDMAKDIKGYGMHVQVETIDQAIEEFNKMTNEKPSTT